MSIVLTLLHPGFVKIADRPSSFAPWLLRALLDRDENRHESDRTVQNRQYYVLGSSILQTVRAVDAAAAVVVDRYERLHYEHEIDAMLVH